MVKQGNISKNYIVDMEQLRSKIVDAVVDFFGEKYRRKIKQNLSNVIYLFTAEEQDIINNLQATGRSDLIAKYQDFKATFEGVDLKEKQAAVEQETRLSYPELDLQNNILAQENFSLLLDNADHFNQETVTDLSAGLINDISWSGRYTFNLSPDLEKLSSIIQFDLREEPLSDPVIIHEHVHASTIYARKQKNKQASVGCGFTKIIQAAGLEGEILGYQHEVDVRLGAIEELFTEYFTVCICENLKKQNKEIILPEQPTYECSYRTSFPVFKTLFDNFLPKLKDFYINNDFKGFKDWLGSYPYSCFSEAVAYIMSYSEEEVKEECEWLDPDKSLFEIYNNIEEYEGWGMESEYFCAVKDIKEIVDGLLQRYKNNDDDDDNQPK